MDETKPLSKRPDRKRTRRREFDYSEPGYYFVTVCTKNRVNYFGHLSGDVVSLNDAGKMVAYNWSKLSERFINIEIDTFIVMPNHIHGIINIVGEALVASPCDRAPIRAGTRPAPTLGAIIGAFKSITTNEYIHNVKHHNWKHFDEHLWQRSFYDHVIRNDRDLTRIREYITYNHYKNS